MPHIPLTIHVLQLSIERKQKGKAFTVRVVNGAEVWITAGGKLQFHSSDSPMGNVTP